MLLRSIYFWVSAMIFIMLVGLTVWKVIPPVLGQYRESTLTLKDLEVQITEKEKFVRALKTLEEERTDLEALHRQAQLALPTAVDSENLLLQLDGLIASLNLAEIKTTVPFSEEASRQAAAPEEKPAEPTESKPLAKFTISGPIDFEKLRDLVVQLKGFGRWNQLTSIDVIQSGGNITATITGEAFFKPAFSQEFSGDSQIINKAKAIFAKYRSYTTAPDISKEGSFGRANPLAPY